MRCRWETLELQPNVATELGGGSGGSALAQREWGETTERERESEPSERGGVIAKCVAARRPASTVAAPCQMQARPWPPLDP
jgi:hypothetical protein